MKPFDTISATVIFYLHVSSGKLRLWLEKSYGQISATAKYGCMALANLEANRRRIHYLSTGIA
jgi:hypothetical protein